MEFVRYLLFALIVLLLLSYFDFLKVPVLKNYNKNSEHPWFGAWFHGFLIKLTTMLIRYLNVIADKNYFG